MATVEIRGWKVGFNKVACTDAIRAATGIGLVEGKKITDAVLEGDIQFIVMSNDQAAHSLAAELIELGAIASVIETAARDQHPFC